MRPPLSCREAEAVTQRQALCTEQGYDRCQERQKQSPASQTRLQVLAPGRKQEAGVSSRGSRHGQAMCTNEPVMARAVLTGKTVATPMLGRWQPWKQPPSERVAPTTCCHRIDTLISKPTYFRLKLKNKQTSTLLFVTPSLMFAHLGCRQVRDGQLGGPLHLWTLDSVQGCCAWKPQLCAWGQRKQPWASPAPT